MTTVGFGKYIASATTVGGRRQGVHEGVRGRRRRLLCLRARGGRCVSLFCCLLARGVDDRRPTDVQLFSWRSKSKAKPRCPLSVRYPSLSVLAAALIPDALSAAHGPPRACVCLFVSLVRQLCLLREGAWRGPQPRRWGFPTSKRSRSAQSGPRCAHPRCPLLFAAGPLRCVMTSNQARRACAPLPDVEEKRGERSPESFPEKSSSLWLLRMAQPRSLVACSRIHS